MQTAALLLRIAEFCPLVFKSDIMIKKIWKKIGVFRLLQLPSKQITTKLVQELLR
jgi:hypothetical protein